MWKGHPGLVCRLQVVHGDVISYRQNVEKLAEQQQSKYLDLYTILPSEISMQLAEVSLALGAIEDQVCKPRRHRSGAQVTPPHSRGVGPTPLRLLQVLSKERDIQKTREIKEDFSSRIHKVSERLKVVAGKFKEKSPDVEHAKDEVKVGSQNL